MDLDFVSLKLIFAQEMSFTRPRRIHLLPSTDVVVTATVHEGSDWGLLSSRLGQGTPALPLSCLDHHIHGEGKWWVNQFRSLFSSWCHSVVKLSVGTSPLLSHWSVWPRSYLADAPRSIRCFSKHDLFFPVCQMNNVHSSSSEDKYNFQPTLQHCSGQKTLCPSVSMAWYLR